MNTRAFAFFPLFLRPETGPEFAFVLGLLNRKNLEGGKRKGKKIKRSDKGRKDEARVWVNNLAQWVFGILPLDFLSSTATQITIKIEVKFKQIHVKKI